MIPNSLKWLFDVHAWIVMIIAWILSFPISYWLADNYDIHLDLVLLFVICFLVELIINKIKRFINF